MSDDGSDGPARELAAAFDASFAGPPATAAARAIDLIAVRAGGRVVVLRAFDTGGVLRCPPLAAMPSRQRALVGLAGVRGALAAVYSLAALLGVTSDGGRPGWLALAADEPSIALGFDELVAYLRVEEGEVRREPSDAGGETREIVRVAGAPRPMIRVRALIDAIRQAAGGDRAAQATEGRRA